MSILQNLRQPLDIGKKNENPRTLMRLFGKKEYADSFLHCIEMNKFQDRKKKFSDEILRNNDSFFLGIDIG